MTDPSETEVQPIGTFWMLRLDSTPTSKIVPRIPATFQRIGPQQALSLAETMGLDPEVLSQRLSTGRRCYAALVEGRYATCGWVTFDKEVIGELGLSFRLAPGEAYIWDCITLPAYRGLRLYPALLTHIVNELHAEGLCRIWIGADVDNVASQTGIVLAGFMPVADVDYIVSSRSLRLRGRSGIPEQLVLDVHRAIFGDAA